MPKLADLHIHTCLSDGTFSPEKVVEYAKAKGLGAIAITDHDCCSGITPAIIAAKDIDMEVIPGVELSAELDEENAHILGYFIDWQDEKFLKKLDLIAKSRISRAKKILSNLKAYGIDVPESELFELSGPGSVGRLHIARILERKGFVGSIGEAFRKYIGNSAPCYVKNFKLSPKEAIGLINSVGGIAVIAHPKTISVKGKDLKDVIALFAGEGIKGIEVYHPDHSAKDSEYLKGIADEYNMAVTGGSDCHGGAKKQASIGKVKIPYELVENLRRLL